jgi:hypothetical protein
MPATFVVCWVEHDCQVLGGGRVNCVQDLVFADHGNSVDDVVDLSIVALLYLPMYVSFVIETSSAFHYECVLLLHMDTAQVHCALLVLLVVGFEIYTVLHVSMM